MKKIIASIITLILLTQVSFAQKAVLKIQLLDQEEIPGTIMDEVEANYGDFYVDQISEIPFTLVENEYKAVYRNQPIVGLFSKTYEVKLKSENGVEKLYFDENGEIILVKRRLQNVELPKKIVKKLKKDYADWTIIYTSENIKSSLKGGDEVYKVTLKNGEEEDTLFFDEKGLYVAK